MLSNIQYSMPSIPAAQTTDCNGRFSRNEKEDMQKAIEYLYDFKRKLDELHPNCLSLIEGMLQRVRHY
jgi:hypothetical protein